jgi:low affinity Fe/Cu permease
MKKVSAARAAAAATAEERADEAAQRRSPFRAWFGRMATRVSDAMGSAWAFSVAVVVILVWLVTGPIFGFSDTWQLVINTGTTIVTFLMVFLIQNTQNRDAKATELKLDELIRAVADARNQFIGAESEPEDRLEREKREMEAERDKPSTPSREERAVQSRPGDGTSHNGEPTGHR